MIWRYGKNDRVYIQESKRLCWRVIVEIGEAEDGGVGAALLSHAAALDVLFAWPYRP